jgi:hypothetical protein
VTTDLVQDNGMTPVLPAAPPTDSGRRWLRWLAAIASVGFAGTCGSCIGCFVVGTQAVSEGSEFATATIRLVAQPWNPEALVSRAAPELLQVTPADKLNDFVRFVARRLGPLESLGPVQNGQWRVFMGITGPAVYSWHFSDCQFERGPGRITMQLVKRGGAWQVLTFNVNSDLLMKDEP